ncbi:hypothetical protein CDD82_7513 [Ophiocordyceps australis]|uniref:Uncharacterized protein n=1 Tax=Ophiocordyceps australis TaxID=1399860 RepID=A0A2C5YJV4_9HYPO|nr:hypothetical protein CDD82_7513 [Ophiocordyceps australis]
MGPRRQACGNDEDSDKDSDKDNDHVHDAAAALSTSFTSSAPLGDLSRRVRADADEERGGKSNVVSCGWRDWRR